jgi:hypothetical protein
MSREIVKRTFRVSGADALATVADEVDKWLSPIYGNYSIIGTLLSPPGEGTPAGSDDVIVAVTAEVWDPIPVSDRIIRSTSAPAAPVTGDIWYDPSSGTSYTFSGASGGWVNISMSLLVRRSRTSADPRDQGVYAAFGDVEIPLKISGLSVDVEHREPEYTMDGMTFMRPGLPIITTVTEDEDSATLLEYLGFEVVEREVLYGSVTARPRMKISMRAHREVPMLMKMDP